jgi:phage shock protein PspC (stress-responsive transcriptional regulator)
MAESRLMRSQSNRMVAGVCGGLGEYLGIDPTFIRIFFLLLVFGEGAGVLIYMVLWILLPAQGRTGDTDSTIEQNAEEISTRARELGQEMSAGLRGSNRQVSLLVGVALVLVGIVYLLDNLNLTWLAWLRFSTLWPVLLILGGAVLLYRYLRGE